MPALRRIGHMATTRTSQRERWLGGALSVREWPWAPTLFQAEAPSRGRWL